MTQLYRFVVVPLFCLTLAASGFAAAAPPDASQRFAHALLQLRQGDAAAAAAEFTALADPLAAAQPALAAEALFRAAQLQDEQLSHPALAYELYTRTAERFPQSRFRERAQRRGADLYALLHTDAAVVAEFNKVASAYLTLGLPKVIARLTKLLAEHPSFPQADRASYLLGTAYRDAGSRYDRKAEAALQKVLTGPSQSPWAPYAQQALAELALRRGNYAAARQRYDALLSYPEPLWQETAHKGLEACTRTQWRQRAAQACWLYLIGLGIAFLFRARRRLLPPPMEVLYYAPVAAFLLLLTYVNRSVHARGTMTGLMLGGVFLAWASGAAARVPTGLYAGLALRLLAAIALCYLAVYHGGMLDLLIETWRMGPESG